MEGYPLLRIRGGISTRRSPPTTRRHSSPHTRRYFRIPRTLPSQRRLFSAYAEVFPGRTQTARAAGALLRIRGGISFDAQWQEAAPCSLLRIRGGISRSGQRQVGGHISSPHTRRYFQAHQINEQGKLLFSAYAEVFPAEYSVTLH